MNRTVRVRICTAANALEEVAGTSSHQAVSSTQKAALLDLLQREMRRAGISKEEAANLSLLTARCNWYGEDGKEVQTALLTPDQKAQRRDQQDYMDLPSYLKAELWENLKSDDVPYSAKRDLIMQFALEFGLRNPTEPSIKLLNSLALVAGSSTSGLHGSDQKVALLREFKGAFKRMARYAPAPVAYLLKLPPDPQTCKKEHSALWDSVYGSGEPGLVDKCLMTQVIFFDQTYQCRGGGTKYGPTHPESLALATIPQTSSLERMAQTMVESISAIGQQQRSMFEMMMGGGLANGPDRGVADYARRTSMMGFPGGPFGNQSGLTNLTIKPRNGPGPSKGLMGLSPPEADASFHTGAHGSTGGANVDEAHPKGAGEAALTSAGSSAVALVPTKPTDLTLEQELQMLQQRDKENHAKNQRDKDKEGTNVEKRKSPSPMPEPKKRPKAGPNAKICLERTRSQVMCRTGLQGLLYYILMLLLFAVLLHIADSFRPSCIRISPSELNPDYCILALFRKNCNNNCP